MKKFKSVICGAVAVVMAAATAAFGGKPYSVKAETAPEQKFAIESGDYTLKLDESVTETVSYTHTESYLFNKRDTDGNIRLKFRTVSAKTTLAGADFYGLVRGKADDPAYAYADSKNGLLYWYVYGSGNPGKGDVTIYEQGKITDVLYDVDSHAFTVIKGGADQASQMAKFVSSKTAEETDRIGATKICWDAYNIAATVNAELEDFALTDADGYDLGVDLSPRAAVHAGRRLSTEYYGYAGKTVTVKNFDDANSIPVVVGEDGSELDVAVTSVGNGEYTFVMPSCAVKIISYVELTDGSYYGTYYNAESGQGYVFGENSYKFAAGAKSDVSVKIYNVGVGFITENSEQTKCSFRYGKFIIGDAVYNKLLKYTVNFVVDGKSVKTVTVDGGEYTLENPADISTGKEGYTFLGWKTAKGETFEFGKTVNESITLYADYRSNEEHKDPQEEKSGCGSSVGAGLLILPMIAVSAFAGIKKRKGNV